MAIGMGSLAMAADFRDKQSIPFPLLVDQDRESHRLVDIKRGRLMDVAGPKVWRKAARNIASGIRQSLPKQDALQLGGALVVGPAGEVRYQHGAKTSSDNAPVSDLLAALD